MKKMQKPDAQSSRTGKKVISGYFEAEVRRQLKTCAMEQDRTQQELLAWAINLLFLLLRKPPIAQ